MTGEPIENPSKSMPRKRPNFSTRTAEGDVSRLAPGDSTGQTLDASERRPINPTRPYEPLHSSEPSSQHRRSLPYGFFGRRLPRWWDKHVNDEGGLENSEEGSPPQVGLPTGPSGGSSSDKKDKDGHNSHQTDGSDKLGTFSGVFVPTTLNILSILMFLRFGLILGQGGLLGMMGLLFASYTINLVTTMSLSAIATNGTVRGGGAYYLISRSLGPEFGGSIGIVFYLGYVLNTGMNAVGLVDCFTQNFGTESGTWAGFLGEGFWWQYLWGTIILVFCTGICLAGSSIFSRASNGLFVILLIATLSIPLSAIVLKPFSIPRLGVEFTGIRVRTLLENLKPKLTKGAAGSQLHKRENFQDLFGILFPATGGIFAGSSMSGDLANPSRSIPRGTLSGLALTFVTYTLVIFAMAASITRDSFYNNANVIQLTNLSSVVVLLGEFASSFFSALMGVIGSAKLLQAISRDSLLPGLGIFGKGTKANDEPINAIVMTFVVAQFTMLFDINRIAAFITMTYLMTFLVTNLACFLLKIGSAPNFRPSFQLFNWQTAAAGAILSGASMFFVDGISASGCVGILVLLFLLIHYTSPPKSWGDVSQSLIYHQVRKYLLRLKQEHVKFWRPQILLFVKDLETEHKLVSFCNSLKKGALFVLGHVIVTEDFSAGVPEARHKQNSWTKFVEYSRVKAFVNIAVSPTAEWGIRNIVLNSGLGGMRPNIVVVDQFRKQQSLVEAVPSPTLRRDSRGRRFSNHPRETDTQGPPMSCKSYLTILEDLLFRLRINVAVAKGFENLVGPGAAGENKKKYIDLWPIQMSAELGADGESKKNVLTTNFDTYTLILQLGCILLTVPSWKKTFKLRVAVFVEYETDVEDERGRVEALLEKLRIEAEVLVFWLSSGELKTYKVIVNGDSSAENADVLDTVQSVLKDEGWWHDIQKFRQSPRYSGRPNKTAGPETQTGWQGPSSHDTGLRYMKHKVGNLGKLIRSSRRRRSISGLRGLGAVNLGMQTHRLLDTVVDYDVIDTMSDEDSSGDESESEPYISDDYDGESEDEAERAGIENEAGMRESSQPRNPTSPKLEKSATESVDVASFSGPGTAAGAPGAPIPSIVASGEGNSPSTKPTNLRPPIHRSQSGSRFSSSPIPEAKVNADESAGPSIMFAPSPSPPRFAGKYESIYTRRPSTDMSSATNPPTSASGYPRQASIPVSFNDLPSRAQHIILNELMVRHSDETAVIFTTLPSPTDGTSHSEEASESYLTDLDVFWKGLPPCLLVHSNSMTVTMNL